MKSDSRNPKLSVWKKTLFSLIFCVLLLAALEGGLRLAGFSYQPRQRVMYKPWVGMMSGTIEEIYPTVFDPPGYVWLMPQSIVGKDADGRGFYAWPLAKKPGVKRVAFLGGSTTQPYGLSDYPRRTIALLNAVAGSNVYENLNLGMSSYTTHQSLIALQRYALPRTPDVVVVYHGWNDPRPHQGGHNDREIDWLMRKSHIDESASSAAGWLPELKVYQLVGRLVDALDFSWPRARVSPDQFEKNLEKMASLCAASNIPMVLVKKPICQSPAPPESELSVLHFTPEFGTNSQAIYEGIHRVYTAVQEKVAESTKGVRLADAETRLNRLQEDWASNAPPEGLPVFMADAMHVRAIGNQAIAEVVAGQIAPERAEDIRRYIDTAGYWKNLALEFQTMDEPFQCVYAIDQAVRRDPSLETELAPVREWAVAQFEFWQLFEEYRWGNAKSHPLEQRLPQLEKCLKMRPSDFGVAQQIHRVCVNLGQPAAAIPLLSQFKPATPQDRYRWLHMLFEVLAAGRRWGEAQSVAQEILNMNPNDEQARQFLDALRQAAVGQPAGFNR